MILFKIIEFMKLKTNNNYDNGEKALYNYILEQLYEKIRIITLLFLLVQVFQVIIQTLQKNFLIGKR